MYIKKSIYNDLLSSLGGKLMIKARLENQKSTKFGYQIKHNINLYKTQTNDQLIK